MNSKIIHRKKITLVFFGIISANVVAEEIKLNHIPPSSLCNKKDIVYFSCSTGNKKTVSLCGTINNSNLTGLYYRFGQKEKIELEYPAIDKREALDLFRYNEYHRALTQHYHVSFINANQRYTIYSYYNGDGSEGDSFEHGIYGSDAASETEVQNFNIKCLKNIIVNIHPLTKILHCDFDSALGCVND